MGSDCTVPDHCLSFYFDFIEADDYFSDLFDFEVNSDYFNVSSKLDGSKFSKNRVSQDTIVNNEGNLLLDMCKSNNLFILNGRCDSDMNVGAMTFRGQSVIDYATVSCNAVYFVDTFSIIELDPAISRWTLFIKYFT